MGTENMVQDWDAGVQVLILNNKSFFIPENDLAQAEVHEFSCFRVGDERLVSKKNVGHPIGAHMPKPPAHLKLTSDVEGCLLSFIPRARDDFDYWNKVDGFYDFPDKHEIKVTNNGTTAVYKIRDQSFVNLGKLDGEIFVEISSVSSTGLRSQSIKEKFIA